MKNKVKIVCLFSALSLLITMQVTKVSIAQEEKIVKEKQFDQFATSDVVQAQAVVVSFFHALNTHNLPAIENFLTGEFLAKYKKLTSKSDYAPRFIENEYKFAHFEITGYEIIKEKKILIDTKILLNNDEIKYISYLLIEVNDLTDSSRMFRISDEREKTNDKGNIPSEAF